jgi:ATP-dependent helicase/nuclease subunit A
MTVHGSKGLEAPLILLADATHDPAKVGGSSSTMEFPVPGAGNVPIVRPRKDECAPVYQTLIDAAAAADREEHWRLAYVALTRAADRLVIAGVKPKREVAADSWHRMAGQALQSLGAAPVELGEWGQGLVWEGSGPAIATRRRASKPLNPLVIPAWLREPAPVEARPPRPLAPSQIVEDRESSPPPTPAIREAARRGTLLHGLFERLPGVPASDRRDLALRWLERAGVDIPDARTEIAEAACSILSDARYCDLFGPGSLGEAPIAATLPDGRVVAGTVDRLCITADRIRVVDFKTGRHVPSDEAGVPPAHRAQMQAYVEALKVIFPDRAVQAALLYTSGPALIALTG